MLTSMGVIGAGAALGGAGTMAFFSDTEEFDGNKLVAGELDLKVDWQQRYYGPDGWVNVNAFPDENGDDVQDEILTREEIAQAEYGTSLAELSESERQSVEGLFRAQFADVPNDVPAPLIDISDVKPGDEGEITFSLHLFDNPGYIQMVGDLVENLENGLTEPELSDPDEEDTLEDPPEETEGELAQAIQAWVWYDENGNNEMDDDEKVFASGRLVDVLAQLRNGLTLDGDRSDPSRQCFPNSTTEHIGFKWKLDVDHANEVQTDSIEFSLGFRAEQCRHNDKGPSLEPYQDELPTLEPEDYTDGGTVEITMQQATHEFHEDLPETTVWGYHDGYLGPNIEAMKDVPLTFRYINDLPQEHLLPVDKTIHGPGPFDDPAPEVRAVTHLHGGNVPDEVDGYPETWTTPDGQRNPDTPVPYPDGAASGDTVEYEYPNTQPASQLWFHDHGLGITRLNVYAGLAGLYTLRDQNELDLLEEDGTESEAIPAGEEGEYEIPLILQDKSFTEDGELFYPDGLPVDDPNYPDEAEGSVVPEFFGDTAVVNGKVWPYLEVEPRKYRFRMLNACNSRFLGLKLFEWDEESHTVDLDSPGPGFTLIGSDGGLFESPMDVEDRLLMNPANRFDVVIDFSGYEGQDFVLHNNARSPFKAETQAGDEQPLPEFMLFRVQDTTPTQPGPDSLPTDLATVPDLGTPDDELYFALEEGEDEFGRLQLLLNDLRVGGSPDPDPELWADDVTTSVAEGETQVWNLVNLTEDVHPIHLHLVQFQIVGRKAFDVDGFIADGKNVDNVDDYVGEDLPLNERQQGWHDTVAARPGELTQVKATWGEFTADGETFFADHVAADSEGDLFPWHCHILEHEDHEMMRPYEVNPRSP